MGKEQQEGLVILTPILPNQEDSLRRLLEKIDLELTTSKLIPFEKIPCVHFLRWSILPASESLHRSTRYPAQLLFSSSFDGPAESYLKSLIELASDTLLEIYAHGNGPSRSDELVSYLLAHRHRQNIFYQGHPGLPVAQILADDHLRKTIGQCCDHLAPEDRNDPLKIRQRIETCLEENPELTHSFPETIRRHREPYRIWHLILLTLTAPFWLCPALLVLILWLAFIRTSEWQDDETQYRKMDPVEFDPSLISIKKQTHTLARREDLISQNQFTHVVEIKPGVVRQITLHTILLAVNFVGQISWARKALLGISTLHFVKWVIIDKGRRLLFISNYDGSAIKYVSDFVDRSRSIPLALTAIWSNTVGFPDTRFLIFRGAAHQPSLLDFLRRYQVPAQVWFSAYPHISSSNILNSADFREGLQQPLTPDEILTWLKTL